MLSEFILKKIIINKISMLKFKLSCNKYKYIEFKCKINLIYEFIYFKEFVYHDLSFLKMS